MAWTNQPQYMYHGTNFFDGMRILNNGINLKYGRCDLDFGRGFYVTTNKNQAKKWANFKSKMKSNRVGLDTSPCLVQLLVDRNLLSEIRQIAFVRGERDYYDFVKFNRSGGTDHGRAPTDGVYDVAIGPVAAWPRRLILAGFDQISFHTEDGLTAVTVLPELERPQGGEKFEVR